MLVSPFYKANGRISYYYFMSSWIMIETGIIGTILYLGTIFCTIIISWKNRLNKNKYVYISLFTSIIIFIQYFYNQMLRVETSGYLMYLILALIYIYQKEERYKK